MSDYIPEVLQLNILKLLPVKTLLRFRTVSKSWKQLIDSPLFLQHHLSLQSPRFLLEYEDPDEFLVLDPRTLPSFHTLRPPIPNTPKRFHLAGTLHGVVCLYDNHRSLYLWNPSIRKFTALPLPDFMLFEWRTNPNRVYGPGTYSAFWIDPSTKNFKIALFKLRFDVSEVDKGAIYSSIEGKWRVVPLRKIRKCKPLQECPAIVIGGVAYWSSYFEVKDDDEVVGLDVVVLSFDLGLERFETIPAPSVAVQDIWSYPMLCSWQGALSLVHLDRKNKNRLDIYLRQERSWCPVFSCNLTSPIEPGRWGYNFPGAASVGRVLWVLEEMDERGKVVVKKEIERKNSKILITLGAELLLCDAKAGAELILGDNIGGSVALKKSGFRGWSNLFLASHFVESLLFP